MRSCGADGVAKIAVLYVFDEAHAEFHENLGPIYLGKKLQEISRYISNDDVRKVTP